MGTPIYDKLKNYKSNKPISFAMPGHKGGRGLAIDDLCSYDVTELDDTVDLLNQCDTVRKSMDQLSDFYDSDKSYYLTGGSTSGIFAMIYSTIKPNDTIAVGSSCHKSVINACTFIGANVVIIPQRFNTDFQIYFPLEGNMLKKAFNKFPNIKAVIVTSPSYYGLCANISELSIIAHEHNVPLLVDEAHGAHFKVSEIFPKQAIDSGADMAVQSMHKTLDSLTSSAVLHVKSKLIDIKKIDSLTTMIQTSSPSQIILLSSELAIEKLRTQGKHDWEKLIDIIEYYQNILKKNTNVEILDYKNKDRSRIVINFKNYDISGYEMGKRLKQQYNIDVEMCDYKNIVAIPTPSNTHEEIKLLFLGIENILKDIDTCCKFTNFPILHKDIVEIKPSKAFFSNTVKIELSNAIGRISSNVVTVYPPGIPVINIGEEVTSYSVQYINLMKSLGAKITGLDNFRVVDN